MRKILLLSAAALVSACGLGAPKYPTFSETSYRIEGNTTAVDGATTTPTVIYRSGPLMRVETALPQYGQATIVFDQSTNFAYVLNPTAAPQAVNVPGSAGAPPVTAPLATSPATPAPTTTTPPATTAPTMATTTAPTTNANAAGATTTAPTTVAPAPAPAPVAGVAVRIADADTPQPMETAWAALGADNARSVGDCEVAGEDGHEWAPKDASSGVERSACITEDGIVLRVREGERVIWEATSLQRGEQDASLFGVPQGYQLIDPAAVAAQVGQNLNQLDSVTRTDPAAPATPGTTP